MRKQSATTSLNILFIFLYHIVAIIGLVSLFPNIVVAQFEVDSEVWIEMRKMNRHKGVTPSIEQDVAALSGPDKKRAGFRLFDRGPEALPAIHNALLSDDVTLHHAQVLLEVISLIGDKSSVPVILKYLKRDTNNPLRRDSLFVLARLPANEESAAFIIELANNTNERWNTRRMAFTWFGYHRDQRGRLFSQALLADPDPEKRSAGLFVLARLGDRSVLKPISQLLAAPPANSRRTLLHALAELTTPEEFQRLAPSSLAWSNGYKESLLYTQYVAAGPKEKIDLCLKMLGSRHLAPSRQAEYRKLAVPYLLENGHASDLRPYAARSALIRYEIRKAGWHIIDTDEEFNITQTSP